jgi:hypothetical protein
VGATFPFQLVAGNHEDDRRTNGFIDDFAACLPDRLGSTGRYGAEYYFDFGGLLRVILIAPGLEIGGEAYRYVPGNAHYDWLAARIDEARTAGVPWVVVGMHEVCITAGAKGCEIGADLMDLLIARRVDLVLQAHDHTYQRSKQLACARENSYVSSCVVDDGADGRYTRGAGTVFVITGAFGRALYDILASDAEAGYFARSMGANLLPTNGFLKVAVSPAELTAEFVAVSGSGFTDRFRIGASADFELLGTHPHAAQQPATSRGGMLETLFGWQGQLYVGYGDIDRNTGPIWVTSWDPAAGIFWDHFLAHTEAIWNYRALGARLYVPAMDPAEAAYAFGPPWEDGTPQTTPIFHNFDMATLTGTDLWIVGPKWVPPGQPNLGVAYRSVDGGASWTASLEVPAQVAGRAVRLYFAGVYQGKLYVHPVESSSGPHPTSWVFDGGTWSNGPSLLPRSDMTGWRPVVFAGRMVYKSKWANESPSDLLAFDGTQVTFPLATGIRDFTVSGAELFVLTETGAVLRTTDLASWTPVATAPPWSRSIGALDGRLYVGTEDSRLYRLKPRPRELAVVVRGLDDGLYENRLVGGAWSGWSAVGGATADDPALATAGDGPLDLAVRGTDGGIYVNRAAGGAWSGWTALPGATPAAPGLVARGSVGRDLFVHGTDGGLYRNRFDGTGWPGWESVYPASPDGPVPAAVAATANGVQDLDLVLRLSDGSLVHLRQVAGGVWESRALGGAAAAGPAVATLGDGTLDLVVAGTDGALYHSRFDAAWSPWTALGGATADAPALVVHGDGTRDVVVRGTDGGVYHNRSAGTAWTGWVALPGAIAAAPALAGGGDGTLDLVVRGTDGGVYHNRFDGTGWLGWTSLGGAAQGRPAIARR